MVLYSRQTLYCGILFYSIVPVHIGSPRSSRVIGTEQWLRLDKDAKFQIQSGYCWLPGEQRSTTPTPIKKVISSCQVSWSVPWLHWAPVVWGSLTVIAPRLSQGGFWFFPSHPAHLLMKFTIYNLQSTIYYMLDSIALDSLWLYSCPLELCFVWISGTYPDATHQSYDVRGFWQDDPDERGIGNMGSTSDMYCKHTLTYMVRVLRPAAVVIMSLLITDY